MQKLKAGLSVIYSKNPGLIQEARNQYIRNARIYLDPYEEQEYETQKTDFMKFMDSDIKQMFAAACEKYNFVQTGSFLTKVKNALQQKVKDKIEEIQDEQLDQIEDKKETDLNFKELE